jgi:hypothetical protein
METKSGTILVQDKSYFRECQKKARMNGHLNINNMRDLQTGDTGATLATLFCYINVTVHHDKFPHNTNQLDALISQIYFGNETLHVSESSSVHHQELFTVHSAMVYVIQVCRQAASTVRSHI